MRGMLVLFYHFYWFIRVDRAFPYVIKTFVGKFNLTLNIQRGEEKKSEPKSIKKKDGTPPLAATILSIHSITSSVFRE